MDLSRYLLFGYLDPEGEIPAKVGGSQTVRGSQELGSGLVCAMESCIRGLVVSMKHLIPPLPA